MEKGIRTSTVLLAFLTLLASTFTASAVFKKPSQEPHISVSEDIVATNASASLNETETRPAASVPPAVSAAPELAESAPRVPAKTPAPPQTAKIPADHPAYLEIPSIGLMKPLRGVGLTEDGAMGVLDDPGSVGWYKLGTKPGEVGSAVLDAHVYQAFRDLKSAKVGDDIFVRRGDGTKLHFVITERQIYDYTATAPLPKIFNRKDKARLNLITCYGELVSDRSTYTHRLVVFAELAD